MLKLHYVLLLYANPILMVQPNLLILQTILLIFWLFWFSYNLSCSSYAPLLM